MIISPTVVSARKHPHRRPGHEKQEKRHHRPMYYISDNGVFFDGHKIKGASPDSFRCGRDGYARDNWHTYYRGRKID